METLCCIKHNKRALKISHILKDKTEQKQLNQDLQLQLTNNLT